MALVGRMCEFAGVGSEGRLTGLLPPDTERLANGRSGRDPAVAFGNSIVSAPPVTG